MIIKIDISDALKSALQELPVIPFKTSPKVIMEVMNVPLCAVKSILREHGFSTSDIDETSICIDEKMLDNFADAYVRKLKNYFVSSSRHISSISDKERKDLKKFYKLFKKEEVSNEQLGTWEDIDENLLRGSFYRKVKKLMLNQFFRPNIFIDDFKVSKYRIPDINFEEKDENQNSERDDISSKILLYANNLYDIIIKQRPSYNFLSIHIGRHKMLSSARYYVFSDDDDHIN